MKKIYSALGLMSGTSLDGIDASIITSDGEKSIKIEENEYYPYESSYKEKLSQFITNCDSRDFIENNRDEYAKLERQLTMDHAEISNKILKKFTHFLDFVGFHGQTIIHKPGEGYSIQMGDGKLLSQLLKKKVFCNFRMNDIKNKGEGAPLAGIYHYNLVNYMNIHEPVIFLNIGGISNISYISKNILESKDIGPGNVLMDEYLKKMKNENFDKDGIYASKGKINKEIIKSSLNNEFYNPKKFHSLDRKNFNFSFIKRLSFEDGIATLTYFTALIISEFLNNQYSSVKKIILCGGGRKNKTLINHIKKLTNQKEIINIDTFSIDGDFIESQAFAYLSIRSYLKKNISFPETTGVKIPVSGGELFENF